MYFDRKVPSDRDKNTPGSLKGYSGAYELSRSFTCTMRMLLREYLFILSAEFLNLMLAGLFTHCTVIPAITSWDT